jgi:hypothetical protein
MVELQRLASHFQTEILARFDCKEVIYIRVKRLMSRLIDMFTRYFELRVYLVLIFGWREV